MDNTNKQLEERMEILNRIQQQFYIPLDLYLRLKKSVKYKYDKDISELNQFFDDLPINLKAEAAPFIHEDTWQGIDYFRHQKKQFRKCHRG